MSDNLQTLLGYDFKRSALLRQAVTHASFIHEQGLPQDESNERLEFLGDAVLELCISDFLYHKFSNVPEGELTQLRANLVCEPTLAGIARELKLGSYLLLGQGEAREKGREKDSILADALEAVFGALYLVGGLDVVRNTIVRLFSHIASKPAKRAKDSKSLLQEILQKNSRETAIYAIVSESGPDHQKHFVAEVSHNNVKLSRGEGKTKKEAEQQAAKAALLLLSKIAKKRSNSK